MSKIMSMVDEGQVEQDAVLFAMAGHNARIEEERGYERKLVQTLAELESAGVVIEHAVTMSQIEGVPITRTSSVGFSAFVATSFLSIGVDFVCWIALLTS
jgi:hypothetical protein